MSLYTAVVGAVCGVYFSSALVRARRSRAADVWDPGLGSSGWARQASSGFEAELVRPWTFVAYHTWCFPDSEVIDLAGLASISGPVH